MDMRTEKGREIIKQLASRVDVLVENFRPGVMEKWGLGPKASCLPAFSPHLSLTASNDLLRTYGDRAQVPSLLSQSVVQQPCLNGIADLGSVKLASSGWSYTAGSAIFPYIHQNLWLRTDRP